MNSLTAEFRESLTEAELLAGLDYARRQGWLIVEGSDLRVTPGMETEGVPEKYSVVIFQAEGTSQVFSMH